MLAGPTPPWLCVALAFVLRVWALRFQPWVTVDGTEYIRMADALARGRTLLTPFPPGYPALIALAHALIPDRVTGAELVSVISGALLPWPVWRLARRAFGAAWALAPALVVAILPELVRHSAITMSESAYLLALYGALELAASARAFPAGLALGAAFAIRPEALLPALVLGVGAAWRVLRGQTPRSRLLLGVAGFVALAVPCWIYLHAATGVWTITPKLELFRAPTSWRQDEARVTAPEPASSRFGLIERVTRHGGQALASWPANARAHGSTLLQLWPVPLLLLSIWGLARRPGLEAIPVLHLAALPVFSLSAIPRFILPVIPALAILAVRPVAQAPRRKWRIALGAIGVVGLAWSLRTYPVVRESFDGYIAAHQEAGQWLSGVAEDDAVVMDRKPYVAFYANRRYRPIPDDPYETIIGFARRENVRYLVVDEAVDRIFRPQLLPLLYDSDFRTRESRLEAIYAGGHVQRYGITIFRILRPGESKSGKPPAFFVRWARRTAPPRAPADSAR